MFGLLFKVLNLVPRHREIVATVTGDAAAGPVTLLIGLAECAMGIWILTGYRPRLCIAFQTLAILGMNAVELTLARGLLLAPVPMVMGNLAFLGVGWWAALKAKGRGLRPRGLATGDREPQVP